MIIQTLKKHKWALIMAVLAGVIIALPQFYFRFDSSYQGIDMPLTGAEYFYQGRIQEVRDGYPSAGNVWFAEYKDRPYIQPPLGEIITAYLGKIFGLDINNTILLARFFFPALILLAIYSFVYFLIQRQDIALIASTGVILADNVFSRPFVLNLLKGKIADYTVLGYARPVNPQVSSFLFFAFLLFFWLLWRLEPAERPTKKKWIFGVLSGILLGLSFYVYFYGWSLILVFMGLLAFIAILRKEWFDLGKIFLVAATALVIAAPYILNTIQAMQYSEYLESSRRLGLVDGRTPTSIVLVVLALIVFLIIFPKTIKKAYLFGAALFVSLAIVLNQQIVTGKLLINDHYHWYYSKPLAFIFLSICLFIVLEKIVSSQLLRKIIIAAVMTSFVLNGIITDAINYSYRIQHEDIVEQQRYSPIIKWLNANAQKDEVVLADTPLSVLISVYTPLNFGNDPKWANQYLVPQRELLERMFLTYRLRRVGAENASQTFLKEKDWISAMIFSEYYRQTLGEWDRIPNEVILSFAEEYQNFVDFPIEKLFQKFKIKYAVWDNQTEPEWSLDGYPFLKEAYRENNVIIYRVII